MGQEHKKRLLELDALRGIAVICVISFHYTMNTPLVNSIFHLGLTGVELFFMISGFVILMTLEKTTLANEFILSRLTRLYPTYWTCVSITAMLLVISNHNLFNFIFLYRYLANMTMFQSYFFQLHLDGPYWTMCIEMLFYILMLFIYKQKLLPKIEMIGAAMLVPLLIYGFYSYHIPLLNMRLFRFAGLINFFPLFFSGILYYKIKHKSNSRYAYILLIASFFTQLSLFHTVEVRLSYINISEYALVLATYNLIFQLYNYNKLTWIANKWLVFLGNISYPLYLIHQFFSLKILIPFFTGISSYWLGRLLSLAVVIAVAYLIHVLIEKPVMRYARSRWLRKPTTRLSELSDTITI